MTTRIFRLKTAMLGFLGIVIQGYYTITRRLEEGHSFVYGLNYYFTYFTVIVNSLLVIILASSVLFPESKLSQWFKKTTSSAALTLYILIVGIIFYALLFDRTKPFGLDQIATHVLHGYVPLAYTLMWFIDFRQNDLKHKSSLKWLIFPLLYFIYVLVRGAIIDAYPYFFVNAGKYGYGMVAMYALGILLFFLFMGNLLILIDNKIKKPLKKN
ncbi:Pr6Pr family membrane protein [bacterium]|nr:Pr6Pr family membrane protein [bacterium]